MSKLASTKTIGGMRKQAVRSKEALRVSPPHDYEDSQATEDEDWVEDLREYLKTNLERYLEGANLDQERKDLLKSVVYGYRNQLARGRFDKHSRRDAWNSILEIQKKTSPN